ncbi:MAG TPA: cytochrome c [Flavobacteriales bacterium]|nr:cytochrome c [Flavobacteriales bacterium]
MFKYGIVLVCFALFSCGGEEEEVKDEAEIPAEELTAEQKVAEGKTLYMSNCKLCHGEDGSLGNSGAKNLQESILSHEDMINVISYGQNAMRGYKDFFKEGDIENIAAFVETLKKK